MQATPSVWTLRIQPSTACLSLRDKAKGSALAPDRKEVINIWEEQELTELKFV